jgi:hypothetical protein
MYQSLRGQLVTVFDDSDLAFTPGGSNMTLGELCREMGEIEYAYIQSFKNLTVDFSYRNPQPELTQSVAALSAWYSELDRELRVVIEGLSEEDIQSKLVDRGPNFKLPLQAQLDVYKEALLLFYGKATVYARALNKGLPEQWREWIG